MLRILRAFAWMRWRIIVNTLELTTGRDVIERFSQALEQVLPIVAAVLFVPAALGLAALAGYAGVALATTEAPIAATALRFLLLGAVALTIVGPIMLPAGERTNAVRLLLLPIPRRVLYVAQSASAISDPWILLCVPIVLSLPIGLAVGGAWLPAVLALVAGLLFVVVLLGVSSLMTTMIHLLLRDRRRGELLALLFIVVLPMAAMLPGLMHGQERRAERTDRRTSEGGESMPAWVRRAGESAFAMLPSELYRASLLESRVRAGAAAQPLAALAIAGLAVHGLGMLMFGRVLDGQGSSRARRSARRGATRAIVFPGVSPGASAVAMAQIRLGLRTPRGRSIMLSPLVVFIMFGILMLRSGGGMEFGFIDLQSGFALAVFATAICLLAILPFAMNQFAIDKSGLTLELLSPLTDFDILIGKAIANGAIAGTPALACVLLSFLFFPEGSPALWLCIPLGALAAYALAAPGAAALSAIFPRAVDLNSIGRGSNAHGLAGLIGMAVFLLSAAPPVLLATLATVVLNRPTAAPVFLIVWCALALAISRLLFIPVAALFNRRRENLGLVV